METLYRYMNSKYLILQRHAFTAHPKGHAMFQDLDDLIRQKENFTNYIRFEYSVAILYNLMAALPAFVYNYLKFANISQCDTLSTFWLLTVSFIKILETLPKSMLLYQTIRISESSTDPIIVSRRLMYLTRSNLFFYNTICGYALLLSYSLYFIFVRRTTPCSGAPQLYHIINLLVCTFFLRLIISFVNYFFHFKYTNSNENENSNDMYSDFQNRVNPDILNRIEAVELSKKNIDKYAPITEEKERESCSICMIPFALAETIKILPCNNKHIFHKTCIDKWLSHNKACPTCRKEMTMKLIQKNKIY